MPLSVTTTTKAKNFRIGIYGAGGTGKTTLASMAPNAIILNVEGGLSALPGLKAIDCSAWNDLMSVLGRESALLDPFSTIVVDSVTRAEQEAIKQLLKDNPIDGHPANSLADYGWGDGWTYLSDKWKLLLNGLQNQYAKGKNVVLIAHEEVVRSPNPGGEDFLRWEPRLQNSVKCNLRAMTKEWLDHLVQISFPFAVDGSKAKDTTARVIYTQESPVRMAKFRGKCDATIAYPLNDNTFWKKVFEG